MFRLTLLLSASIVLLNCDGQVLHGQRLVESQPAASAPKSRTLPLLVLEGTPYERGLTHGRALRTDIGKLVELWKEELRRLHKSDPDRFIKLFVEETDYRSAIEKWTPQVLEEIRGISDGAGIDFATMYVFQFLDETWARGDLVNDHCSSMGFTKSEREPAYVAQTMDLETFRDGYQVVLHIKDANSDIESLLLSNAGCIGWCGVNNKSIGICSLAVDQLRNCRDGLPANCVTRGVLLQRSEQDAIEFVSKKIRHASGLSYVIGGPDEVYCFECSANQVVRYRPDHLDYVVWHTNHPLANDDYTEKYQSTLERLKTQPADGGLANTRTRLESLINRLGVKPTGPRLDLIKNTLASKDSPIHPICGSRGRQGGFFTFSATIMVLGKDPELQCTFGPPDQAAYEVFTFSRKTR